MSKTSYLQRLGHSWYVRVKIPASLRGERGSTHVRRALGTTDLAEANRLKWAAIASIRAEFDRLSGHGHEPAMHPAKPLGSSGMGNDCDGPPLATDCRPRAIAGFAIDCKPMAAVRLQSVANGTIGLDELLDSWLSGSDFLKTTCFQRRKAYAGFREYAGANLAPEAVTASLAATYVDEHLRPSSDAPSTKRQKLSALGAFWEWLAMRRHIPKGENPWRGFRLSSKRHAHHPAKKRPYTDDELVRLFAGAPKYRALKDVMVLGLYTGARIDEICSLRVAGIRWAEDAAFVQIAKSKTDAGCRTLAISHPIATGILRHRWRRGATQQEQVFPELTGGGYDSKLSWGVGHAFQRHRNACGLSGETDFHSLRRTFITRLENLGVDQVRIARYVGHRLPTLAFTVYSGGSTEVTQLQTGNAIHFPKGVEDAIRAFLL